MWDVVSLDEQIKEFEDAQEEARKYFWRTIAKNGHGDLDLFRKTMALWDSHFEESKKLIIERCGENHGRSTASS